MKRVSVSSLPGRRYAMQVEDRDHVFIADEAGSEGGDDLGPTPYELLLTALGSCMAITLLMYAERKQWPVADVSVSVTHDRVLAADCTDCTPEEVAAAGPEGRIDLIRADVSVRGELTPEQRDRLLEIANRCPVHRALTTPPKIVSSIAAAG